MCAPLQQLAHRAESRSFALRPNICVYISHIHTYTQYDTHTNTHAPMRAPLKKLAAIFCSFGPCHDARSVR